MSERRIYKRATVAVDRLLILSVAGCADGGEADDQLLREEKLAQREEEIMRGRAALARERAGLKAEIAGERDRELAAARAAGEQIRQAAQAAADGIRAAAELAGRTAGEQAARAGVADRVRQSLAALDGVLAQGEAQREARLAAATEDIIALAVELARKVVHDAVAVDPAVAVRNLQAALLRARGQAVARVRVSQADYERLTAESGAELAELHTARVLMVADAQIEAGGAMVETEYGSIDATLAGQLALLKESLLAAHAANVAESAPAVA